MTQQVRAVSEIETRSIADRLIEYAYEAKMLGITPKVVRLSPAHWKAYLEWEETFKKSALLVKDPSCKELRYYGMLVEPMDAPGILLCG